SSEFDVRPFITKYPEKTLKFLKKLTNDNLALGRRLSSEGTRPRLPLSSPLREFIKDPSPVIEILELLKDDPSLIVRRSVANNLNDISKDNPDIVVSLLEQWSKKASKERKWLIGHALRTLLKQGHQGALAILGYFPPDEIELPKFSVNKDEITLGDEIKFEIEINNKSGNELKLMIDYLIYFMKANGKQSPKVFKLSKRIISPYEKFSLNKKHQIKPLSTRKIYQGRHCLQIKINGKKFEKLDFNVRF
ncbi:MAG: DNA alkylation repair protein, partial [Candidatus Heimdallarchaeota archaeon]